eukprot:Opistho-2@35211
MIPKHVRQRVHHAYFRVPSAFSLIVICLSVAVLRVGVANGADDADGTTGDMGTCGSTAPAMVMNEHPSFRLELKPLGGRGVRAGKVSLLRIAIMDGDSPVRLHQLGVFRDQQFMHVRVLSTDLLVIGHATPRAKKSTRLHDNAPANGTIVWSYPTTLAQDEIIFTFPSVGWYLVSAVIPVLSPTAGIPAVRLLLGKRLFVRPDTLDMHAQGPATPHWVPAMGAGIVPEKSLDDRPLHVMPSFEYASSGFVSLASFLGVHVPATAGTTAAATAPILTPYTVRGRIDMPPSKLPTGDPVRIEICLMPPPELRRQPSLLDDAVRRDDEEIEEVVVPHDLNAVHAVNLATELANKTAATVHTPHDAVVSAVHGAHPPAHSGSREAHLHNATTQRTRDLRHVTARDINVDGVDATTARDSEAPVAVDDNPAEAEALVKLAGTWLAIRERFVASAKLVVAAEHCDSLAIASQSRGAKGKGGMADFTSAAALALGAMSNPFAGAASQPDGSDAVVLGPRGVVVPRASQSHGAVPPTLNGVHAPPQAHARDPADVIVAEFADDDDSGSNPFLADDGSPNPPDGGTKLGGGGGGGGGLSLDVNEMPLNILPAALQSPSEESQGAECVGFVVCFGAPGAYRLIVEARDPESNVIVAAFDVRTEEAKPMVSEGSLVDVHARLILSPGTLIVSCVSLGALMSAMSLTIRRHRRRGGVTAVAEKETWFVRMLRNAMYILLWYIFSTVLTFYNKWFFSKGNFSCPLFVTVIHMAVSYTLSRVCVFIWPSLQGEPVNRRTFLLRVVPTGVAGALDIGLSNFSLLYISVALYTVCKSSIPFWTFVVSIALHLERARMGRVLPMVAVCVGVILGAINDGHKHQHTSHSAVETAPTVSPLGIFLVMGAAVMGGVRLPFMQLLMQRTGGDAGDAPQQQHQQQQQHHHVLLPSHHPRVAAITSDTSRAPLERKWSGPDAHHNAPAEVVDRLHYANHRANTLRVLRQGSSATLLSDGSKMSSIDDAALYPRDDDLPTHAHAHAGSTIVDTHSGSAADVSIAPPKLPRRHPVTTLYYVAPVMGVSLLPLALVFEYGKLWVFYESGLLWQNVVLSMVGGVLAFMMTLSAFHVVHRTSGITLSLAGVVKEVLTILLSVAILGDHLSPLNYFGLFLSASGIVAFHLAEEHH